MAQDANFTRMFNSLSSDVSKLTLTQDQVLNFVQKHRSWLYQDGYATFFLFSAANEFFVARVYVYSGGRLKAGVYRLGYDYVWYADCQHRLAVPQL